MRSRKSTKKRKKEKEIGKNDYLWTQGQVVRRVAERIYTKVVFEKVNLDKLSMAYDLKDNGFNFLKENDAWEVIWYTVRCDYKKFCC